MLSLFKKNMISPKSLHYPVTSKRKTAASTLPRRQQVTLDLRLAWRRHRDGADEDALEGLTEVDGVEVEQVPWDVKNQENNNLHIVFVCFCCFSLVLIHYNLLIYLHIICLYLTI